MNEEEHKLLNKKEIFERISLRDPYFALENVRLANGEVYAEFHKQHSLNINMGPITPEEVGRHLAILGSIGVAFQSNKVQKKYYLALHADIKRKNMDDFHTYMDAFQISAKVIKIDKKMAQVDTKLSYHGKLIYLAKMDFLCINEKLFSKMFNKYKMDMRLRSRGQLSLRPSSYYKLKRFNPYVNELPLQLIEKTDSHIRATLGKISPYSCKGHFPQYPCLPVAVLMGCLNNVNQQLLREVEPAMKKGCLLDSKIKADNLVLANSVIDLESTIIKHHGDIIGTRTVATSPDGEVIFGEADTIYQVLR